MKPGVRVKIPPPPSFLNETFAMQIVALGLPAPEREFVFDEKRGWMLDFAWIDQMLAVELEGHDHRLRDRYTRDIDKYNALAALGWTLLHFTRRQVMDLSAVEYVRGALEVRS